MALHPAGAFSRTLFRFTILALLIVFAALISTGLPLSAREDEAVDQDPDFSTIDDPLDGDYELYTVDDLLISRTKGVNGNKNSQVTNYILETANNTISKQTKRNVNNPPCYLTNNRRQPQVTRIGRFFNLEYEVMITLAPTTHASGGNCAASGNNPNMSLHIQDVQSNVNYASTFKMSAIQTSLVMDDFNQDGFEDLFILSNEEARVATAHNVEKLSDGMKIGPSASLGSTPAAENDPVSGDFNDDGLLDVAWIANDHIYFATICSGSVTDTVCAGKEALDVILNPREPLIVPVIVGIDDPEDYQVVSLASGEFGSFDGTGLMAFAWEFGETNQQRSFEVYVAHWYQFENNWDLTGGQAIHSQEIEKLPVGGNIFIGFNSYAMGASLDWFGSGDQVVFAHDVSTIVGAGNQTQTGTALIVHVITFNPAQNSFESQNTGYIDSHNTGLLVPTAPPWLNGLAVGHFSAISDDAEEDADFNLQIAVLRNDGVLHFFSVDANDNLKPVSLGTAKVDSSLGLNLLPTAGALDPQEPTGMNWLVAGDLQGRSALLGQPTVMRVSSHSQPSVILGAPPMHVDYIKPDTSTGSDWEVVNFSAIPDTFHSSYTMSQTGSNQSSDTNRTSYTFSTSTESGGKISFKSPYLPSISASISKTSENKNEDVSETYTFTQNEFAYDASTITGFGDEIWYDESSFNVYFYPVIGETVCPADNSDCTGEEEQPLYVTFSGPNSGGTGPGPGANTEWYQPVHEPGNIFSYPWNETQLAAQIEGGIDLLTGPQSFFTDDSDQAQRLQWSSGSGSNQTAGTTNSHSYEKAYSLTSGKVIFQSLGANISGNQDYNSSTAVSTLNKSSSSVGASQGVVIAKPGTFLDSGLYQYRVQPYIFGRAKPSGQVDNVLLPQDIQTTGPLQAAYAVNPLDPQAGSWWGSDESPYTKDFDVALNHPKRWTKSTRSGTQDTLNCLEAGSRNNCMTINDPDPSDLWNSEFYWMRGLFLTVGGVDGPQRAQADEGDDVVLQARVYNYSFKDMPADSTIKVRFYRQEINGTTPVGNSVLIAEKNVDPLPGFNSDNSPNAPNWTTATATLDTTGLGDTLQIFWVLVWVEDGSGNMVEELQGHGLSAKPGTLQSIGDVPLEMVMVGGQEKTFSNNVGYLHRKFHIVEESLTAIAGGDPRLEIIGAKVTPDISQPGERVIVSAHILSEGAPADGVHVQLYPDAAAWEAYQQDPSLPAPRPFDVEMLPHIDVGRTDQLSVPYRSLTCGTQEILITARSGVLGEQVTAKVAYDNGPCQVYMPVMPIAGVTADRP